jgi:hypothetical protein
MLVANRVGGAEGEIKLMHYGNRTISIELNF